MNNQTSENKDEKLTGKTPDSKENETPKAEPAKETAGRKSGAGEKGTGKHSP